MVTDMFVAFCYMNRLSIDLVVIMGSVIGSVSCGRQQCRAMPWDEWVETAFLLRGAGL